MAGFFELIQDPNKPDSFQNLHMLSLMIDGINFLEDSNLETLETYNPLKLYGMYLFFRKSLRGETYRVLEMNEIRSMVFALEAIIFNKDYVMQVSLNDYPVDLKLLESYAGDYKFEDHELIKLQFEENKETNESILKFHNRTSYFEGIKL